MLSSTGGYVRHSRALCSRMDEASMRTTLCPAMSKNGRCKAFACEMKIRAAVSAEKEKELVHSASELYALRMEVLGGDKPYVGEEGPQREAAIKEIVNELKQEQSYIRWSLDVAVTERMAQRGIARCLYSHQRNVLMATQQGPAVPSHYKMDGDTAERNKDEKLNSSSGHVVCEEVDNHFAVERWRVFGDFSPMQKCVACLLWQRTFSVPKKVICDMQHRSAYCEGDCEHQCDDAENEPLAEEEQVVSVTTCHGLVGAVDFSSLPNVVAYISQHPEDGVIRPETVAYFTRQSSFPNSKERSVLPVIPPNITEKEVDLSVTSCAHEFVMAVVWTLRMMVVKEGAELSSHQPEEGIRSGLTTVEHARCELALRSLTLRRCAITNADALITALHKHGLGKTLLALDMSENRLVSLRFLFILRTHFSERLLRLSLADNPITRKPEYREQIRTSLPRLTSLDGVHIRRPPLRLPYPTMFPRSVPPATSDCVNGLSTNESLPSAKNSRDVTDSEVCLVMDNIARFFYVWEARRIPWTELELEHMQKEAQKESEGIVNKRRRLCRSEKGHCLGGQADEGKVDVVGSEFKRLKIPREEELDDDNFHHRYLHPSATFSMSLPENLVLFKPDVMREAADVELDANYTGMRLSTLDAREVRVFDVAVRNNSRNLLMGRSGLHRYARGSLDCYATYKCSLYPSGLSVNHHLPAALVSISKVCDGTESHHNDGGKKQKREERRLSLSVTRMRKPVFYIVTMHGTMSWRAPSMRRCETLRAAYDRVITLVENGLFEASSAERRRMAPLLIFNDQLHLRPLSNARPFSHYLAQTEEHVVRLVVEFGLEACEHGRSLVTAVIERAGSDAAANAALQILVFGTLDDVTDVDRDDIDAHSHGWSELSLAVPVGAVGAVDYFDVYSLLGAETSARTTYDSHRVTLAELDATVTAMNARFTLPLSRSAVGA
ncbi:hypothetical protein ERJ75_000678700 [Trypanosoma vivax]|nr:hypothetical protein ERJ75_000678700 [Trypanosoma vivax]